MPGHGHSHPGYSVEGMAHEVRNSKGKRSIIIKRHVKLAIYGVDLILKTGGGGGLGEAGTIGNISIMF